MCQKRSFSIWIECILAPSIPLCLLEKNADVVYMSLNFLFCFGWGVWGGGGLGFMKILCFTLLVSFTNMDLEVQIYMLTKSISIGRIYIRVLMPTLKK